MRLPGPVFLAALALLAVAQIAAADDAVDYIRQIKPLLKAHCYACHGALKQEGGLRLDTAALALKGGDNGPALVAGKPTASAIIERVTSSDASVRMPQEGTLLTASEIDLIRRWIAGGAAAPTSEQPQPDPRNHWAFQPPQQGQLPVVHVPAARAVDAFLAAKLAEKGLSAAGPATKEIQLRRLYLDLVGIPPTRDELHVFLADQRPDAYERVVDRLLASPQYGERWARHWMDVWRYSDWYGRRSVPDVMNSYPQIWRWRDWIVRSLNDDQGYDQMILEMLAADELWPEDQERHAATGFIVRNWFKWNYDTWMRDQVEHTGKAFLGLTFNCALCHDHKYDPISQEEYFRFRAIFEPLELRHDRVPGQADPGPFKKYVYAESYGPIATGMIRVFDEKLDAPTFMYRGGDQRNKFEGRPAVAPGVPAILGGERFAVQPIDLPPRAYYPGLRPLVQEEELAKRRAAIAEAEAALAAAQRGHSESTPPMDEAAAKTLAVAERAQTAAAAKLVAVQADLAAVVARIRADVARYENASSESSELAKTAANLERQANQATARVNTAAASLAVAQAEAASADDKRAAAIAAALTKLAAAQQAETAAAAELAKDDATYTPLGPIYPAKSSGRRAALARWIASPENPLTARVAANHVWRWHFGRPLVETTANFGQSGKPPSQPELLDWLAVEFMDSGWSFKGLSRKLVTSDAYRRASEMTNDQVPMTNDPDNIWYWRANLQRMEAEVVRDSVLAVAGELDQSLGGPEIDHAQGLTSRRRSLYFAHHGESKMELLELFDGASATDCYERSTSIRPQQALALANSELTRDAARQLAARLQAHDLSDEAFVGVAFEHLLARPAMAEELAAAVKFLGSQPALIQQVEPMADSIKRSRASLIHVLLNHHDFVTIR
jgi:mono/diheme cytochrome c family protein